MIVTKRLKDCEIIFEGTASEYKVFLSLEELSNNPVETRVEPFPVWKPEPMNLLTYEGVYKELLNVYDDGKLHIQFEGFDGFISPGDRIIIYPKDMHYQVFVGIYEDISVNVIERLYLIFQSADGPLSKSTNSIAIGDKIKVFPKQAEL